MDTRNNLKIAAGAVVLLAAIGLAIKLHRPATEASRDQQLRQGRIHFALRGAMLLRDRMHNPSLQFASIRVMGDDGPICYTFRAAGSTADANAVLNDDSLVESRQPSFAPLWQQFCVGKSGEEVSSEVTLGLAQHDKTPGQ